MEKPVASVQSGHRVATTVGMLIDPRNLKIFALYVTTAQRQEKVLHTEDIRDVSGHGIIVDNNDQLMDIDEDLVRLREVREIDFQLLDKPVYTERKKKLGKVSNFVVETEGFVIMKLHVGRSVAKSFSSSELIIDRSQIVQITDDKIIVRSTAVKEKTRGLRQLFLGKTPSLSTNTINSNISRK